jgi:hypothetical protein
MALCVRLPFSMRTLALPVLMALYRSKKWCEQHKRPFKSWPVLARQMAAVMLRWFPTRKFILLGDGGFATMDLACFADRHRDRFTMVTRFYDDASLRARPRRKAKYGYKQGQPPKFGVKLPNPKQAVERAGDRLVHSNVAWYGGGRRDVRLLSGVGGWHRHNCPLVGVRWVYVKDVSGTHRDEYLMSTDPTMRPEQIVSLYTQRWPLEVTFQESRLHLGVESPRQRCEKSVTRMTPLLLGLYTLINLMFAEVNEAKRWAIPQWPWYRKQQPTFADALASVREELWQSVLSQTPRSCRQSELKSQPAVLPLIRTLSLAG